MIYIYIYIFLYAIHLLQFMMTVLVAITARPTKIRKARKEAGMIVCTETRAWQGWSLVLQLFNLQRALLKGGVKHFLGIR